MTKALLVLNVVLLVVILGMLQGKTPTPFFEGSEKLLKLEKPQFPKQKKRDRYWDDPRPQDILGLPDNKNRFSKPLNIR